MQDEILEIVDIEGKIIGVASRLQFHSQTYLLHKVIHVLVFNSEGELLLQKRSKNKDIFSGKWDTSVGGHVLLDENIFNAAKRETKEELGFIPEELHFLYSYIFSGSLEREFVYTFSTTFSGNYEFNKEEIDEIRFWKFEEMQSLIGSGVFTENLESEVQQYFKRFK
jgi:isopentenyldiphosphate isomerase